ncbi:MAG: hypothetical protein ABI818_15215 [Acidobacteriota bacterium]
MLSVVVATVNAERTIDRCLAAWHRATAHIPTDIVVVDASTDRTIDRVAAFPGVRAIAVAPGALVPALWARGLESSRSRFVAFAIGQCEVTAPWGDRMMAAMTPAVGGAGGAFALRSGSRPSVAGWFFLRYSNYLEGRWTAGPVAGEIAGDNALYRRSDLSAAGTPADGFWEIEVHRRLRRAGLTLVAVDGGTTVVIDAPAPGRVLRERFVHGRHFGAYRATSGAMRLRLIAAAPLVPALLVARIARRVWPAAGYRPAFVRALPWLCLFAAAWALGEAAGACRQAAVRTA